MEQHLLRKPARQGGPARIVSGYVQVVSWIVSHRGPSSLCLLPVPTDRLSLEEYSGTLVGWTYQAYVASEVIQFYTEDWKPYLGLDIFNHKESPIILLEMERAMNFTTGIGRASTGLRQSAREALSSFNASNSA